MESVIARFVETALTYLNYADCPGMTLPQVFDLFDSLGKNPAESKELVDMYLDMAPKTWVLAGGNPFWAVFREEANIPMAHPNQVKKAERKVVLQCALRNYRSLSFVWDRLEESSGNHYKLLKLLEPQAFEVMKAHWPIEKQASAKDRLIGLTLRHGVLEDISSMLSDVVSDKDFDPSVKNMFVERVSCLTDLHRDAVKTLLKKDFSSSGVPSVFKGLSQFLSIDFQRQLFIDCVDILGEKKGQALCKVFDAETHAPLRNVNLVRMMVRRHAEIDTNGFMARLGALGHKGLGSEIVSRCLALELIDTFGFIANGDNPRSDHFWLEFAVDRMESDKDIRFREWPAILFHQLAYISQFDSEKKNFRVTKALAKIEKYLTDNPQCVSYMVDRMVERSDVMDAFRIMNKNWPIADEMKSSIVGKIASEAASRISIPKLFDEEINRALADKDVSVDPYALKQIGKKIFRSMSVPRTRERFVFKSGSIACVAHYLRSLDLGPKDVLLQCKQITKWDIQKQVIEKLSLPTSVYRHLSPRCRADMLGAELGL